MLSYEKDLIGIGHRNGCIHFCFDYDICLQRFRKA